MNPVLLKPGGENSSQVVVLGPAGGRGDRAVLPADEGGAARAGAGLPGRPARRASTSSSARAPAPPPRSTCAPTTSPTWAWPRRRGCRSSSWATSTAAASSPRCTAPWRSCRRPTSGWSPASWSTSSAATSGCCSPGSTELAGSPAVRRSACCPGWPGLGPGRRGLPRHRAPTLDAGRPAARGRRPADLGGPAAPAVQRHRPRRARRRARRAGALRDPPRGARPTPTWWCCPAPAPRSPTSAWLRATGLADAVLRRAADGRAGAGHLRRAPDAGPDDHRRRRVAGRRPCPGWGCCPADVRFGREKTLGRPVGLRARASRCAATRSTTASSPRRRRRAVPGRRPRRARCSGRPGTARWRTTGSGGRSSREVAPARRPAVRAGPRHRLRRHPRGAAGPPRRPGRRARRHRRAVAADRAGAAGRPAAPAARRSGSREPGLQRARGCRRATAVGGPAVESPT